MGHFWCGGERSGAASAAPSVGSILDGLELASRHLAVLLVPFELEADLLAFAERAEAGAFHGRDVDEDVRAAVVGLNEAEALGGVEPLHCASRHVHSPCCASIRARPMTHVTKSSERIMADSGARSEEQAWRATEPQRYSIEAVCALFRGKARKTARAVSRRRIAPAVGGGAAA